MQFNSHHEAPVGVGIQIGLGFARPLIVFRLLKSLMAAG